MVTKRLDLELLLAELNAPGRAAAPGPYSGAAPIGAATKARLNQVRTGLLALHKALLEDAKSTFAALYPEEPLVRIDEMTVNDSTSTEADARTLTEQIDKLLVPSESGDTFSHRYFDAIQRQPGVVLAHGDVKRALRSAT